MPTAQPPQCLWTIPNWVGPIIGVLIGYGLTFLSRRYEETWFGAKLAIDAQKAPANLRDTADKRYFRFRVCNTTERRTARNCRAYLIALHTLSNGKETSGNLLPDSFQLPWAGHDFEPRDLPAKISQYVDLITFSKHVVAWEFRTHPDLFESLTSLKGHKGTYCFTVLIAGDSAKSETKRINVDYYDDWKKAKLYDA